MRHINLVGWVERSDTHHYSTLAMGIAALHPSYTDSNGFLSTNQTKIMRITMDHLLTEKEAFQAMVVFLDCYYERGNSSDTLADVLSAISQFIWADGIPNDPAQWQDWLDAVSSVKKSESRT